jgi:PAS domain S-box-containing protein
VRRYGLLDPWPEVAMGELAKLAAHLCDAPIALVTLIDESRQLFKTRVGWEIAEVAREHSFCAHAIAERELLLVSDVTGDERFADNPLVTGDPGVRFYAGMPLISPDGFAIGTLCLFDRRSRTLTSAQLEGLRMLARQVMAQLNFCCQLSELGRGQEEHERTVERLRTSEAFYETLVETLPQNILRKDVQGRFTFANRKFCHSLGRSLDEIVGRTDFDLFPADLAGKYHRDDLRVMSTLENLDTVEAHPGAGGQTLFVHVIKTPLYDSAGSVVGIQGIFWDVTESKRIEQELAYERDLLRALLDHIPDRLYFKDLQSRFLRCSRSMARSLGQSDARDVTGKTDFDFYPAEVAQEYFDEEQRLFQQGHSMVNKLERQLDPGGNESWASVTKVPIYSHTGAITGLVGLSRDITQLKQTERALRQAEETYRAMYENSVEGMFQTTGQGQFLSANRSLARIYGYGSPDDIVAALTDVEHQLYVDPDRRDQFSRLMREQDEVSGFESQVRRKDGSVIWISESARTVKDADGTVLYYEGIVEDITARKLAEFDREHAREAALESARTKAQFLANMSHEIRTPMNAITGMTGLLAETRLSGEQHEYVEAIQGSTETLLGVISDILDYSKIEAGKLTFEAIDFELREAVEGSVEMLAERANKDGIELACWLEPDLPGRLRGDPVRLRQVVTNLVSNAVKFTEQGEVVVTARKVGDTESGLMLRIEVKDTGVGIAPEAMPRIFQEFTQADGSTTRKYGGTGLGLTITHQIVSLMQGEIGVESDPGRGSMFWVQLPFERVTGDPAQARPLQADSLRELRTLVVDDNATHRGFLARQLREWGMISGEAGDVSSALDQIRVAAAESKPYQLLLVDVELSGEDGLALVQTVKSDPELPGSRVIMMSSLHNRLTSTTMQGAGIVACLVKPIRQGRLFGCLVEVMSQGGLSAIASAGDTERLAAPLMPDPVSPLASGVRILLAEDNAVNQRVALKQLKKLGFSADAVSTGNEVLAALQRVPYDIIIMDCHMPEMDGYEVTRRIRQSGTESYIHLRSAPYIIALTANAMRGDRERCLALGMNDYLTKPLHLREMEAGLKRALLRIQPTLPAVGTVSDTEDSEPLETLDATVIRGLRDLRESGEPDPLGELVRLFYQDAEPRLAAMESGADGEEWLNVVSAAHTLKGSASNLGARRLASLCSSLEQQVKAGEVSLAPGIIAEVKQELSKVREALDAELER